MKEYEMTGEEVPFLKWEGRILKQEDIYYLGYTNSSVTMKVKGQSLYLYLTTGQNDEVNQPGLRVYVDGEVKKEIVLKQQRDWYLICEPGKEEVHEVKIVKITEAAMSYAGLCKIKVVDGELYPLDKETDDRVKVEFIGDSITCGYGVHGLPESEYTIREEDGECCYASYMAKEMNWNARWISASGYGMYVEYTGNPDNNVPKLYPYVNWFVNPNEKIAKGEFEPRYIFINLGTNDSGHLDKEDIREGFLKAYEDFLYLLREYHPASTIICLMGTLCENVYPYIGQVVDRVKEKGMDNIYAFALPYHDVEHDGMASGHPSITTHKKDAKRILDFMRKEHLL